MPMSRDRSDNGRQDISDNQSKYHFYQKILGKNSRRRRGIYRGLDRSSMKTNWVELQNLKSKNSKGHSNVSSENSEYSDAQPGGIESSIKDTIDKNRDKSIEIQDDESVKALLTDYEDLTNNINAYFKAAHATTSEAVETGSLEIQLNDTSEFRGNDTTFEEYETDNAAPKSFKDLFNFDKINQSQKNDRLFKSSKLLLK